LTVLKQNGKEKSEEKFETDSGIPVHALYSARAKSNERPGSFPFTRGIYPEMFRERLWTMREYSGFGTAEDSNKRLRYLLERGQTGLSVAFDLPTQLGLDSDNERSEGEVGKVGVAISTIENMETLLSGIPVDKVSTSMTINATAATLLGMYVAAAESRGIPRATLRGTTQNDILKEYAARNTFIYPPDQSFELSLDLITFCSREMPKWHPISISGYHIREAGATAIQELAFTFANAIEYVRGVVNRGYEIDAFCDQLSFFFACRNDFFEEIAKFRAARRMWATIVRDRFNSRNANSMKLKFHAQTSGETLTAQQPQNNIVRVSIQALAAVLGGAQSLHTNSFDEALGLPSEDSVTIALRTQQIIAEESGVIETADPIGGSFYLESLTDEMEARATEELDRIERLGGALQAIKTGYIQKEIQKSAYEYQKSIDAKSKVVVGVNFFEDEKKQSVKVTIISKKSVDKQLKHLERFRRDRNKSSYEKAISILQEKASRENSGDENNLVPPILNAIRGGATTGEISAALRNAYGEYHPRSFV